jgi:hypothetical protein
MLLHSVSRWKGDIEMNVLEMGSPEKQGISPSAAEECYAVKFMSS